MKSLIYVFIPTLEAILDMEITKEVLYIYQNPVNAKHFPQGLILLSFIAISCSVYKSRRIAIDLRSLNVLNTMKR